MILIRFSCLHLLRDISVQLNHELLHTGSIEVTHFLNEETIPIDSFPYSILCKREIFMYISY